MTRTEEKTFVGLPSFDPESGTTVREPLGQGKGFWVGAPSATFSQANGKFYIAYRVRKPHPERGFACELAESVDGIHFTTVNSIYAASFNSPSFEKSALIEDEDGRFRLYLSYVDPETRRWRIDLLRAQDPAALDAASSISILKAEHLNSEGVKDPCVFRLAGRYYMMASYLPNLEGVDHAKLHEIQDASAIGLSQVYSALLDSPDGIRFRFVRDLLVPGSHWDRLSTVATTVMLTPPWFTIFFDGRRDASDSYEGKAGLAVTSDFETVTKLDVYGPRFASPHATGSLRYVDVVQFPDRAYFYYEYARPDGSHELRVNVVEA